MGHWPRSDPRRTAWVASAQASQGQPDAALWMLRISWLGSGRATTIRNGHVDESAEALHWRANLEQGAAVKIDLDRILDSKE